MRLFIGLPLQEEVRRHLESKTEQLHTRYEDCRFISPENWHVTIAFLGNVEDENFEALKTLFKNATQEPPRGPFFIHEFRTFPPKHPSYVVAHAVPKNHADWKAYVSTLRDMVSLVAPQVDRKPWVPHISIARSKHRAPLARWSEPIEPLIWTPQHISIVESKLTKEGATYERRYDHPINI